jgi:hypothetical protein
MKIAFEDVPLWAKRALQGVTFWIGHRRCVYRGYPLAESALVAEICNLIYANLPNDFLLQCEVQYSNLLEGKEIPTLLTQRARADLLVSRKPDKKGGAPVPKYIIEVKRAGAPKVQIDADLRRLAAVRREHKDIRVFMFLIAEAQRPTRFVNSEGVSIRGKQNIPKSEGQYRVRGTWKAAHAFSKKDGAQYACLLEAFGW